VFSRSSSGNRTGGTNREESIVKALALCGSARVNGNTERLLQRCLDILQGEGILGEMVRLAEKRIDNCTACGGCRKEPYGSCTIDGDDFEPIFRVMCAADIIIVGSPVYFGSATPQIMALLDRAGYVARAESLFARKLGGPVVVARRAGQNFTYAQLMYWYMINGMIVPGSTYWNIGFGAEPGDVESDEEAVATVDRFAENLAWLAHKIEG